MDAGFTADPSTDGARTHQQDITRAVEMIVERRAVIEQAKGMLMHVYGITADAAFDALRWRSQHTNVKLLALADRLLVEFAALGKAGADRSQYDRAFLTLHLRLPQQR